MGMNATLTVDRLQLRAKLEERLNQCIAEFENDADVKSVRETYDKLVKGETDAQYRVRLAEYYREIADGLESGTITIGANGRMNKAPEKPKPNVLYVKYQSDYRDGRWYTKESAKGAVEYYDNQLARSIKPLKTAIELLDLSSEDTLQIAASDYQSLLS